MSDLVFSSAKSLAHAIQERRVRAVDVMQAHLDRIVAINPILNAVVLPAPDALERARQADEELDNGVVRGPLHGLPFSVVDVIGTTGLVSELDRRIRRREPPRADATVVARMQAAGAILLAKTNCPPAGRGRDTENAITGRTLNPYHHDHTPGGGSGGEAALVAAGGSPLGLGSDAGGGLRVPAHYCGVAALKPTAGRVPNTGVYNHPGGLSDPVTQLGPVARTVDDLAFVLPLLIGPDGVDAGVAPVALHDHLAVQPSNLTIAYFGQDRTSPVSDETNHAVGSAAQALARAGVGIQQAQPRDLVRDARAIHEAWQAISGSPGQDVVETFTAWDYLRSNFLRFLDEYDALLCPADHHAAPPFRVQDPQRFDYAIPFSMTGNPCVVVRVRAGQGGLPIGVQVVARPWREDVALALAKLLETELGGWRRPSL